MSLDDTIREQLVRARRGQGLFRRRVLEFEPICRITGLTAPNLLIASHIKPWRACGTAAERLDGANGLMLAPHADFLFDRGLLGFESDGRPIFSSQLTDADADKLGMHVVQRPLPKPLHDDRVQNKISAKSYASRNCAYFPYFTAPRRTSDLIEICAISAKF